MNCNIIDYAISEESINLIAIKRVSNIDSRFREPYDNLNLGRISSLITSAKGLDY